MCSTTVTSGHECDVAWDIPWARTDMGLSRCDVRGARLWNNHLQTVTPLLYKKSFHKQISKFFIRNYEYN